jgi:hypothetical protein
LFSSEVQFEQTKYGSWSPRWALRNGGIKLGIQDISQFGPVRPTLALDLTGWGQFYPLVNFGCQQQGWHQFVIMNMRL